MRTGHCPLGTPLWTRAASSAPAGGRMRLRIRRYRTTDRRVLEDLFDNFQEELVAMDDLR